MINNLKRKCFHHVLQGVIKLNGLRNQSHTVSSPFNRGAACPRSHRWGTDCRGSFRPRVWANSKGRTNYKNLLEYSWLSKLTFYSLIPQQFPFQYLSLYPEPLIHMEYGNHLLPSSVNFTINESLPQEVFPDDHDCLLIYWDPRSNCQQLSQSDKMRRRGVKGGRKRSLEFSIPEEMLCRQGLGTQLCPTLCNPMD